MSLSIPEPFWNKIPPIDLPCCEVSADSFGEMLTQGFIVDGRSGGLVLGRSHDQGNIYIVHAKDDRFAIEGSLQGGEYVVNQNASAKHRGELDRMNSEEKGGESPLSSIAITPFFRVFSCWAEPFDRLLWLNRPQVIMNRGATKKYLDRLIELDLEENQYVYFDLIERLAAIKNTANL